VQVSVSAVLSDRPRAGVSYPYYVLLVLCYRQAALLELWDTNRADVGAVMGIF